MAKQRNHHTKSFPTTFNLTEATTVADSVNNSLVCTGTVDISGNNTHTNNNSMSITLEHQHLSCKMATSHTRKEKKIILITNIELKFYINALIIKRILSNSIQIIIKFISRWCPHALKM